MEKEGEGRGDDGGGLTRDGMTKPFFNSSLEKGRGKMARGDAE